jgi:Skp family chaperone for outer membrane proteins
LWERPSAGREAIDRRNNVKAEVRLAITVGGILACAAAIAAQAPVRGAKVAATVERASAFRVAVVDVRAVERSAAGAGTESLEEYRSKKMAGLQPQRDEIQALVVKINEGGAALTPEARQELLEEMRRRQESLRNDERQTRAELEAAATASTENIRAHIRKVAEARGVQLVLERSADAVLFHATSIDLTAAVIESLQAKPAKPIK